MANVEMLQQYLTSGLFVDLASGIGAHLDEAEVRAIKDRFKEHGAASLVNASNLKALINRIGAGLVGNQTDELLSSEAVEELMNQVAQQGIRGMLNAQQMAQAAKTVGKGMLGGAAQRIISPEALASAVRNRSIGDFAKNINLKNAALAGAAAFGGPLGTAASVLGNRMLPDITPEDIAAGAQQKMGQGRAALLRQMQKMAPKLGMSPANQAQLLNQLKMRERRAQRASQGRRGRPHPQGARSQDPNAQPPGAPQSQAGAETGNAADGEPSQSPPPITPVNLGPTEGLPEIGGSNHNVNDNQQANTPNNQSPLGFQELPPLPEEYGPRDDISSIAEEPDEHGFRKFKRPPVESDAAKKAELARQQQQDKKKANGKRKTKGKGRHRTAAEEMAKPALPGTYWFLWGTIVDCFLLEPTGITYTIQHFVRAAMGSKLVSTPDLWQKIVFGIWCFLVMFVLLIVLCLLVLLVAVINLWVSVGSLDWEGVKASLGILGDIPLLKVIWELL